MKNNTFLLILLFLGIFSYSQEKNILFIGNSLTYYYEMPKMLEKMLNENGSMVYKVTQVTSPGTQLQQHVKQGVAKFRFDETNWDFVVLQHGTLGYYVSEEVNRNILPSIKTFKEYDSSGKAQYYLFCMWVGKEKYPYEVCYPKMLYTQKREDIQEKICSQEFQSREEQKDYLTEKYTEVAKKTQVSTTKHELLEYEFEKKYPDLNMWDDESHPSKIGSFFNACVFFKTFSNGSLTVQKDNFGIDAETANVIRSFVENNYSKY